MALLPTGSNKLLEINTSEVNIVIKSKKNWTGITLDRSSSIVVEGRHIKRIRIDAAEVNEEYEEISDAATYSIMIPPIFFEQTDYEIVVNSINGEKVSIWNENYSIREKIGPVVENNESLVSGVINFENMVGYSDLEVLLSGKHYLTVRIEVFPTKITYKQDYQQMVEDISEMVCAAAIDFMQKTYQMFSLGEKHNTVLAVYFQILSAIFKDYMNALNRIISVPHHKLITEHSVVPEYKSKRTDRKSEKWLLKHQEYMDFSEESFNAEKVLTAKKQITYDTSENKFVKFIIKSTIIYLNEAKEFDVEPGLDLFDDFHLRGKLYDKKRRFRIPQINIEKTNVKVNNYLYKYHLHSVDILTKLLGYNQDTSIKRLFEGSQTWAGRYPDLIYKLSWILDKPFEQLLVIDYHKPDTKANSEYATELLGKDRGLIFNHFYKRSEKERDYFLT